MPGLVRVWNRVDSARRARDVRRHGKPALLQMKCPKPFPGWCSAVVSGGACECRARRCGHADAPACDGYSEPDEACIFALTGCDCLRIP
jgi:hypothetical protein